MPQFGKPPASAPQPSVQKYFPQSPGKRPLWPVLLLVGLPLLGLLCCCTSGVIYWLIPSNDSAAQARQETTEEKLQRVRGALNSDEDPRQHAQYPAIEQLLDRLVSDFAAGRDDLGDNVDYALHYREMVAAGKMKPAPFATRKFFINSLRVYAVYISPFAKFKIAHIDDLANGKEALVYAYVSADDESMGECCLWCVNDRGRWKIYDWEQLDWGIRASHELAIVNADSSQFFYQDYISAHDDLTAAAEANRWEDREAILRKIRGAEGRRKIGELQDQMWLRIAYAWSGQAEWKEALRSLEQIGDPRNAPGAEMHRAQCYFGLERYDEAIEHADKYEALIGRCPSVFNLRALCYEELAKRDLAAKNYRGWLASIPDNDEALNGLARVLDWEHLDELREQIESMPEPLVIAQRLAQAFVDARYFAGVDAMLKIAKETGGESAATEFMEGLQAEVNDEDEQALRHYQRAIAKATEAEDIEIYTYRLMDHGALLDRPLDVYNLLDDKQAAFETLVDYYEEGDCGISAAQFQKLLAAHQKLAPQDPNILRYAAAELVKQRKYDEAIKLLESALPQTAEDDALGLKYSLIRAYAEAGRERDALLAIEPAENTFATLANILSRSEDFERLRTLVDLYRKSDADDQSILRWEAELLEHRGQTLEAIRKLQAMDKDADDEWRFNLDQQKILELAAKLTTPQAVVAKDLLVDQELVMRKIDAFIGLYELDSAHRLADLAAFYGGSGFRLHPLAEAKILVREQKFAEAAAIMSDHWISRLTTIEPESKLIAVRLLARSARESGDLPRAERYAQMLADEDDDNSELARIACLQQNPLRLAELLKENGIWVLSYPANLRNAYLQPVFNSVRRQYPWDWPSYPCDYTDMLFFASAQNYEAEELTKRIADAFEGKATLQEESVSSDSPAEKVYSFTAGTLLFKISVGTQQLWSEQSDDLHAAESDLLRNYRSWICLESISSESFAYGDEPVAEATLRKTVLRALDGPQVLGMAFNGSALPIESARTTLLKQNSAGTWEDDRTTLAGAAYVWLAADSSLRAKFDRAQTESLWKAAKAFHKGLGRQKLELKLIMAGDIYKREVWTTVYDARPANYGNYDFRVILQADSDLLSHQGWHAGEPFSVSLSNIVDWRTE